MCACVLTCVNVCACVLTCVCVSPGGPPCVWRCDRHGGRAVYPGGSDLRGQPLLLRLRPEHTEVHLPQEVCLPVCLNVCLSACLSVSMSVCHCLSVCLSCLYLVPPYPSSSVIFIDCISHHFCLSLSPSLSLHRSLHLHLYLSAFSICVGLWLMFSSTASTTSVSPCSLIQSIQSALGE